MKTCITCEMTFRGEPINTNDDATKCFLCSTGSWGEMMGMVG